MKKIKRNIFYRNPLFGNCPQCNTAGSLRRSRVRNTKEQIVKYLTPFKLFRCNKCGWRGTLSTFTITLSSLKTILIYLGLSLVTAFIVFQILKRFV